MRARIRQGFVAAGLSLLALGAPAAAQAASPVAVTGSARHIAPGHAQLTATVIAASEQTEFWFEWGLTTAYGNEAPILASLRDGGAGTEPIFRQQQIGGLQPETTYHFRVV